MKGLLRRLTADYTEEEYQEWLDEDTLTSLLEPAPKKEPMFHSMKEVSTALLDLSESTGYGYDFLVDVFNELLLDGNTIDEAFNHVYCVSMEHDW